MEEDPKNGNILIPVYDLDGKPVNYYKDNPGKLQNGREKVFFITRYKPGNERKTADGKEIKYDTPKGAKTLPWISPNIIEAYRTKTSIDTIVITEGYIKGISGWLNGLHIFALSGIQNFKDKDTGTLHPDIIRTIQELKVNNVILLYDGDCNEISLKALSDGKDLYQRPAGFFNSAKNIVEFLKDHKKERHFDVYFAHINSSDLEGKPKGLDDLFEAYKTEFAGITNELLSFSKQKPFYFTRINITAGLHKVLNHLHISNADTFYTFHQSMIGEKPFIFHGTKYQYDNEKRELKVIVPGAARNYFRVGDCYFEKIKVPNKYGVSEYRYDKRQKGTIIEDHGPHLIKHIPKYKAFCTKPDHVNYQEIIDNCFNRYKPFEHNPGTSQECPETLSFFKHIFGEQYELGLDYVQLLYQKPTQMLPILCLVSRENNTGKSTFAKLLKAIFTGNMAIIGNADLENDFNAGWADKLIICCEESFIDKKKTVEKIKSLSTGDKIMINQKGVDQAEIDFFGKFLFMSNNEVNFVIANEHDERFWVRRVPKAETERTNLLELMSDEIPNFLYFLNNRQLSVQKTSRMWFSPSILKTDALRKLIEGNKSGVQKELTTVLKHLFIDTGFWELKFTVKYICEVLLKKPSEKNYIEKILKENFGVTTEKGRYVYPVMVRERDTDGKYNDIISIEHGNGRPFTFRADNFLTKEELDDFTLSDEARQCGQESICPEEISMRGKQLKLNQLDSMLSENNIVAGDDSKDLPF